MDRIVPPDPWASLPLVEGGEWVCNDTSRVGSFRSRPVCRVECDDPSHVAVDEALEPADSHRVGWAIAASVSRLWYSYWSGWPELPRAGRDEKGRDCNGDMPWTPSRCRPSGMGHELMCLPDRRPGQPLSYSARWAHREPASESVVDFTLRFDHNMWPATQAVTELPLTAPGLAYP